jgi:ADP-heptose:LPS heptosyltransferase
MTIPVIYSLAKAYPMDEIKVLSRRSFETLFVNLPANVHFIGADFNGEHRGFWGLNKLYRELKSEKFDFVADFHSVLRSNYLRFRFSLKGARTASYDKGRSMKKRLTRQKNKYLLQIKSSFIRYSEVLQKLDFRFDLNFTSIFEENKADFSRIVSQVGEKGDDKWLGIAPFAMHKGKIYPLELQEKVISHFATDKRVKIFVFGGGKSEKDIIDCWASAYPTVVSMVGKLAMGDELILMSKLDMMYSMDSANMHLASLVGTPVVSLWGATHPYAGFMGWNQSLENAVQVDLSCRPCSIYGQKPCYRHDYACLNQITPATIIKRIENLLF